MVHIEETVTIEQPVKDVFDYLANVQNLPHWMASVPSCEVTSAGQIGRGSTFRHPMKVMGREIQAAMEVTEYQAPHLLQFEGGHTPLHAKVRFELTPEGAATRIVQTIEGETAGVLKLADPLIGRAMSKQTEADLHTLKALMEGVATAASSR